MSPEDREQTLVLIKPDALKLSLTGYILSSLSESRTDLRLAGAKIVHVSRMLAEEHYAEHREKPFFQNLLDYIQGREHYPDKPHKRRVVALIYCGPGAAQRIREIAGPTNPHVARDRAPNTLRALGTIVMRHNQAGEEFIDRIDNIVHASANPAAAEREIKLWFKPSDIMPYMRAWPTEVCEEHYYYRGGHLTSEHRPGDTCLLAPGEVAWSSDLAALGRILAGLPIGPEIDITTVAAKYMINAHGEE
ncbi:MAG: nucleoside-diphosphate kinase [Planctomycetota bacterium]